MQLLYVWIEEYNNIKEQGFSFSSEFLFDYDKEKGVLTIEDNPNYIPEFFGEGISNVTAIVGKNGSGKSSLLQFIAENILVDLGNTPGLQKIVVGKLANKEGLFVYFNVRDNKSPISRKSYLSLSTLFEDRYITEQKILNNEILIKSKINNLTSEEIHISYDGYIINNEAISLISLFDITPTIYYSNEIDYFYNRATIDISSNYWLKNSMEKENSYFLLNYKFSQVKTILTFIKDAKQKIREKIPFKLPEYVSIEINSKSIEINDWMKEIIKESRKLLKEYVTIRDSGKLTDDKRKRFAKREIEIFLAKSIISHLYAQDLSYNKSNGNSVWDKLLYSLQNFYTDGKIVGKLLSDFIQSFCKIIVDEYHFDYTKGIEDSYSFRVPLEVALNILTQYMLLLDRIVISGFDFLEFNWDYADISTGEKSFINILSRFFASVPRVQQYLEDKNRLRNDDYHNIGLQDKIYDIIILIDEGEAGFHPQWQKEYLSLLINVFPQIFEDKKLQIILTSHSPFLISDLPKQNVIFIDNGKVVPGIEKQQTFGQNIHTLLADGFFLEGGLMGDFAKGKIQEVIDWLREDKISESVKDIESAKKVVNLIGEPLLKFQLNRKLEEKAKQNEEKAKQNKDLYRKYLESELAKLDEK